MKNNLIKTLRLATLLAISNLSVKAQNLYINPEDQSWYPSVYGAKDEIGAANLLTPEVIKQALPLVKQGKSLSLAVPINKNLPAFRHRSFHLYNIQPGEQGGQSLGPNKFTFNDELVNAWTGVGTQLNGIGHIGINNIYYNGNKATDFVTVEGVKKLGIEKVPPFVTRGVILDMTTHYGKTIVPGGTEKQIISYKEENLVQNLLEANNNQPFDIGVDLVGNYMSEVTADILKSNGMYVDVTALISKKAHETLFNKGCLIMNISNYTPSMTKNYKYYQDSLLEITRLIENGIIIPPNYKIVGKLSLETVLKAQSILKNNQTQGNKLIMIHE